MYWKQFLLSLWLLLPAALPARADVFGSVRGIVHDPHHRPVADAQVVLRAQTSDWSAKSETNADGEFMFTAVAVGQYRVTVAAPGFSSMELPVTVVSGTAPVLHFPLNLEAEHQTVEVSEQAELVNPESATVATLVGRERIERTPGADRTNSLAMITNYVPGAYITHDQLHVRGGHQVTWAVDGVPVPNTNIASNVGPQFDPKDVDYVEVQRGGYSADFGDRSYGVFNVVPRTGFERQNQGELVMSFGSFHQTNDQVSIGSHTERFAYYLSLNGNRTDQGLETPGPRVIHDQASGAGGFGTLVFNLNPTNQLRVVASARRDHYQIPNDPALEAAGTRDVEKENDAFVNFSWVRTAGHGVLFTVTPFYHFNRAHYVGGPNDQPLSPEDNHASQYAGAQASVAVTTRRHNARAGVYGFGQHDDAFFGLTANDGTGIALSHSQARTGQLQAFFVEDQYKLTGWLTLTGGVRFTHFDGGLSETATSPRLGAALRIPKWNWVFRGFYGRYYQAPPLSTVSGPLQQFALTQGFAFLPLHGERDESREFGIAIPLRGWVLDVSHFNQHARNYFDHDVLGNSNIFLPLTIDGARIRGWEVTVRSPRILRRGQVHLAYSHQEAEGQGGISGGLTDFSPPAGRFLLDHDQQHTLSAGFQVDLPRAAWISGNLAYGSGFALNSGPEHLPGHTTFDLAVGKTVGENWTVSLNAINAANRRFLLDQSATFGGTHYADPRQVFAQVRYRFKY